MEDYSPLVKPDAVPLQVRYRKRAVTSIIGIPYTTEVVAVSRIIFGCIVNYGLLFRYQTAVWDQVSPGMRAIFMASEDHFRHVGSIGVPSSRCSKGLRHPDFPEDSSLFRFPLRNYPSIYPGLTPAPGNLPTALHPAPHHQKAGHAGRSIPGCTSPWPVMQHRQWYWYTGQPSILAN